MISSLQLNGSTTSGWRENWEARQESSPLAFVKVLEELPKVVEEKAAQKGVGGGGGTTTKMTSKQGDDSLLPRAVAKMSYQARSDLECSLKVCLYILTDTSRRYVGNIMLEMQWVVMGSG